MSNNHTDHTTRFAVDPAAAAAIGADELRHHFHIADLFEPDRIKLTYTHYDRMIVGGVMPIAGPLALEAIKPTGTKDFLDRRELIAVNIGGVGKVEADGQSYDIGNRDMIYLGMGTKPASFASRDASAPAKFYLLSAPAHQNYPVRHIRVGDAKPAGKRDFRDAGASQDVEAGLGVTLDLASFGIVDADSELVVPIVEGDLRMDEVARTRHIDVPAGPHDPPRRIQTLDHNRPGGGNRHIVTKGSDPPGHHDSGLHDLTRNLDLGGDGGAMDLNRHTDADRQTP